MNTTTFEMRKVAWVRDHSYPQGMSAPGKLNCPCGNAPLSRFSPEQGNVTCTCGKVYTWDGWIVKVDNE